jgi:putative hydrolase of the HAD superfamily
VIRFLLLDLDGVLRIWPADADAQVEHSTGVPAQTIRAAAFAPELLHLAVTGRISDEEWRRRIAVRLARQLTARRAERAVRLWSASAGVIDPAVLAVVRACRLQIPVCLLTNATTRLRADLDRLGLSGEFDFVVNSAEVAAMKPHAAIFQAALRLAGVPPPGTLYVDDTREHVAAAQQLGIRGHLFRGVEDLTQELVQCGVLTRAPSTQE